MSLEKYKIYGFSLGDRDYVNGLTLLELILLNFENKKKEKIKKIVSFKIQNFIKSRNIELLLSKKIFKFFNYDCSGELLSNNNIKYFFALKKFRTKNLKNFKDYDREKNISFKNINNYGYELKLKKNINEKDLIRALIDTHQKYIELISTNKSKKMWSAIENFEISNEIDYKKEYVFNLLETKIIKFKDTTHFISKIKNNFNNNIFKLFFFDR